MIGLNETFTEYSPFFTINFVFSLSIAAAAIEGLPSSWNFKASAVILYSPSFKALTSWTTVAGSSAFGVTGAGVAVAGVVAGAVVELVAGVAVVAVGFAAFDEFVVEVVVFATTGVSSAANAKLSWSYASIAATAENIAVADKTFNNVVFFILGIFSFILYII